MQNKNRLAFSSSIALIAGLGGCASLPDVSRTYYFPVARQDVAVVQTVGCIITQTNKPQTDADKTVKPVYTSVGPYSTATATVSTTYIADYANEHTFNYRDLDNLFGDADIAIGVTDDGRLASINASGTGEGAAIIKAAVTVASVATGAKPFFIVQRPVSDACRTIQQYGTANDKATTIYTLTLNYKMRIDYQFGVDDWGPTAPEEITATKPDGSTLKARWNTPIPVPLNTGANPVPDKDLSALKGAFTFTANRVNGKIQGKDPTLQPTWTANKTPSVYVPSIANLQVIVAGPTADMSKTTDFFNDYVLAPTSSGLPIPVPAAPVFGKIATTAQFGPSGVVEKLEYNKASPFTDLINSGAQIYNQAQPNAAETTAQKAAAIQAQSDLIYQQQRLITCQLDPTTCPSK